MTPASGLGRWRPPRGRHRLPPEVVARSQRERLREAAISVVAAKGYRAATIADLTREAGVSRTTFYELFGDKEACVTAAYREVADALVRRVVDAYELERRWPGRVRAALSTLLSALAEHPDRARLAFVEGAAGPTGRRRLPATMERLTPLFDEGRYFAPGGHRLPASTSRMAIGAVSGLIAEEVAAGGTEALPDLERDVLFAALVPYLGPDTATAEVERRTR